MRALGLLTPMSVLALDDWEIARDRVVINRKLGEGAFGTVCGGECFFDEKGWVRTKYFSFSVTQCLVIVKTQRNSSQLNATLI